MEGKTVSAHLSEEVIKHIQVGREKKKLEEELIVGCIRFRKLFHR